MDDLNTGTQFVKCKFFVGLTLKKSTRLILVLHLGSKTQFALLISGEHAFRIIIYNNIVSYEYNKFSGCIQLRLLFFATNRKRPLTVQSWSERAIRIRLICGPTAVAVYTVTCDLILARAYTFILLFIVITILVRVLLLFL